MRLVHWLRTEDAQERAARRRLGSGTLAARQRMWEWKAARRHQRRADGIVAVRRAEARLLGAEGARVIAGRYAEAMGMNRPLSELAPADRTNLPRLTRP